MISVRLLVAATLTLALVASTAASAAAGSPAPSRLTSALPAQHVSFTIRNGDRIVEPNFAVAANVPVRLTVKNYTHEFHSFTVPGFGLSAVIKPAAHGHATTTTVRFTPTLVGTFVWDCVICPSGMHGHPHQMGGHIYVIIDPAVFG